MYHRNRNNMLFFMRHYSTDSNQIQILPCHLYCSNGNQQQASVSMYLVFLYQLEVRMLLVMLYVKLVILIVMEHDIPLDMVIVHLLYPLYNFPMLILYLCYTSALPNQFHRKPLIHHWLYRTKAVIQLDQMVR